MVQVKGFKGIRPTKEKSEDIAAVPYDVVKSGEAKLIAEENPLSFLKIDRAEINFDEDIDFQDPKVYEKAKELIEEYIAKGFFLEDPDESIYIYEQQWKDVVQKGIVCLSSCEDYLDKKVKIHEHTLTAKEIDRTNHIDITNYHTGPIFLLYREKEEIQEAIEEGVKTGEVIFDFERDGVKHKGYRIEPGKLEELFKDVDVTYIADGHHRCKSAINVYEKRKEEDRLTEGSGYFLSVIFPKNEVKILPYNRIVKDLSPYSEEEFVGKLKEYYEVEEIEDYRDPVGKFNATVFVGNTFYSIDLKEDKKSEDPVDSLDAAVMQKYIFDDILGIKNPKEDKRLEFVGGIREPAFAIEKVKDEGGAAFFLWATTVEELLNVADHDRIMPPKCTWFEPKLQSGLFLHRL